MARRHGGKGADLSTLDVWDQHLATAGAELLAQRLDLVAALQPLADKAYEQLAPGGGPVGAGVPRLDRRRALTGAAAARSCTRRLLAALAEARKQEIERGVTLVGPHRDDLRAQARPTARQGLRQPRRVLVVRAGAAAGLVRAAAARSGDEPVLVLDDVFAELDARRRERLAELVAPGEQVLVTAAVDDDVPGVLAGARFAVADGTVVRQ